MVTCSSQIVGRHFPGLRNMPSISFGSSKNMHAYTSVGNPRGVPGHPQIPHSLCLGNEQKGVLSKHLPSLYPPLRLSGTFPREKNSMGVKTWGNKKQKQCSPRTGRFYCRVSYEYTKGHGRRTQLTPSRPCTLVVETKQLE